MLRPACADVCTYGKYAIQLQLFLIYHEVVSYTYIGNDNRDNCGPADLFVLRFYGPVKPMGSFQARSVYLTTRLLGRLSPLSG